MRPCEHEWFKDALGLTRCKRCWASTGYRSLVRSAKPPVHRPRPVHYVLWGVVGLAYGLGLGGMAFGPFWSGVIIFAGGLFLHGAVRRWLGRGTEGESDG